MTCSAVLTQITRVTDGQMELAWHIRAIAYMLSRIKNVKLSTIKEISIKLQQAVGHHPPVSQKSNKRSFY